MFSLAACLGVRGHRRGESCRPRNFPTERFLHSPLLPSAMCLIIVLFRPDEEYPLILAGNRDESYDRPGEPPQLLSDSPRAWGGRDPQAGGTWLGLNEHGLLAALTDGPTDGEDRARRSRGLLCLEALKCPSAAALGNWLSEETGRQDYNAFNLLWSDGESLSVAYYVAGSTRVEDLPPGLHILANTPRVDDDAIGKVSRCRRLLRDVSSRSFGEILPLLAEVCADHGSDPSEAICLHGEGRGTLSSSIIALHRSGVASTQYLHARGRPCESDYAERSGFLHGRASTSSSV